MSRPRAGTLNLPKEPHSISLKVLRLSRPNLAQQHPLPRNNLAKIPLAASSAFPSTDASDIDQEFLVSNIFTLPPAFGSAYVGETFSCSLCANNELLEGNKTRSVSNVKIVAEMQTPTQTASLSFQAGDDHDNPRELEPGDSLQRIVRFDLKEEGNHVLVVNVSYSETLQVEGESSATSGRLRSFRKLYQFVAQPCLSIRTKATELAPVEVPDKSFGPYGRSSLLRYVLEAQLENVSEGSIMLEQARLNANAPFRSTALNWDSETESSQGENNPLLNPRDVLQVAFLVEQEHGVSNGLEDLKTNLKKDGRTILGQISIEWRSSMGEKGHLATGNLLTRRKQ